MYHTLNDLSKLFIINLNCYYWLLIMAQVTMEEEY